MVTLYLVCALVYNRRSEIVQKYLALAVAKCIDDALQLVSEEAEGFFHDEEANIYEVKTYISNVYYFFKKDGDTKLLDLIPFDIIGLEGGS